jgi:uridylate kinase
MRMLATVINSMALQNALETLRRFTVCYLLKWSGFAGLTLKKSNAPFRKTINCGGQELVIHILTDSAATLLRAIEIKTDVVLKGTN